MGQIIGIDLGTCYSAVASIDETGRPQIVHNREGQNITASCVDTSTNPITVGEIPYKEWGLNPSVAARFKLQMGSNKPFQPEKGDPKFKPSQGSYTPTDLSSIVLSHLKKFTEEKGGRISEAVVTVPANWGNEAREATMSAAKQAGLPVRVIINEPTAAALYYAFKEGLADGNYAVFDLGGGTFDISIVKVSGTDVEVLGSSGIQRLGGDDFDKALRKKILEKCKTEHSKHVDEESDEVTKLEAEIVKKILSSREEGSTKVGKLRIVATRQEFESLIADKLAQLKMLCEAVMDDLNMKPEDIAAPILVGGSTRIPCVRNLVQKVFKKDPIVTANVDEVVALGAAIYAARHADKANLTPLQAEAISKVKIQERTGRFLGTLSLMENESRGGKVELVNSVIIKKGEKLPARGSRSFFTIREGQTKVLCRVTESDSEELDPTHVKVLNEETSQELTLPPNRPAEQEIKVTYEYQIDQTVRCFFEDVSSGEKKEFVVSVSRTEGSKHSNLKKFIVE
jgi:molecular chaperone DnaK